MLSLRIYNSQVFQHADVINAGWMAGTWYGYSISSIDRGMRNNTRGLSLYIMALQRGKWIGSDCWLLYCDINLARALLALLVLATESPKVARNLNFPRIGLKSVVCGANSFGYVV